MIRLGLALLALAGLAAGCGSSGADERNQAAPPPKQHVPPPRPLPKPTAQRIYVSVIDGDTHRKVTSAVVKVGRVHDRVSRRAIASLAVPRRGLLHVTAWAPKYARRTVRLGFRKRNWRTIFIYRRSLQWPMYGVTPQRTQAQTAIRIRPPFRMAWSRGMGGLIEFPAVVSDGVAFIGNAHGIVRAVSMRTGKVAWRRATGGKMAASPAISGDELVVHGMNGRVYVLDRYNGRVLHRYSVGSPIESSPVVRHGIDYFGAWNGVVYALDLRRGRFRWTYRSGYKITSSASLAGPYVFIGDYGGRLLALSAATGRLRWSGSVNGRIYGTPAVAAGRVFVPSSDGGSLTAFSTGGARLWSRTIGSYNGLLYCVSARTGATLWTASAGGRISGAAVVVDGIAYAGATRRIIGVDALSGRLRVNFRHGDYVPVSGNGQRLLFHGFSRLYALEPRSAS